MSTNQTQHERGQSTRSDTSFEQRMTRWWKQLEAFSGTFETEMSEILELLTEANGEAPPVSHVAMKRCEETTEFRLIDSSPSVEATPAMAVAPPPTFDSEPDRLAALKAKLTQQLATAGQPSLSTRTPEKPRA